MAPNNMSSIKHRDFVETSIDELLRRFCIQEADTPPFCSNPLTVAESAGKLRLVLDLRHVNNYICPEKFRYEDLQTFSELFAEGDYFFTFDLKSGYHHIDINENFI